MNKVEIDGQEYEVVGEAEDGLPILRGVATTVDEGFDEEGNPKISVNITVPAVTIGATPGQIG